jgi:hypothetical protein
MKHWGNIIWSFLHTFVENIDTETFNKLKVEIIKLINTICTNLPCSLCSNHYKKDYYLKEESIFSQNCLKLYLWNIHNEITVFRGEKVSPISILNNYTDKNSFSQAKEEFLQLIKATTSDNIQNEIITLIDVINPE